MILIILFVICVCCVIILIAGQYYISSMEKSVINTAFTQIQKKVQTQEKKEIPKVDKMRDKAEKWVEQHILKQV